MVKHTMPLPLKMPPRSPDFPVKRHEAANIPWDTSNDDNPKIKATQSQKRHKPSSIDSTFENNITASYEPSASSLKLSNLQSHLEDSLGIYHRPEESLSSYEGNIRQKKNLARSAEILEAAGSSDVQQGLRHQIYHPLVYGSANSSQDLHYAAEADGITEEGFGRNPVIQFLEACKLQDTPQAIAEMKAKKQVMRLTNVRDRFNRDALVSSHPQDSAIDHRPYSTQKSRKYVKISNNEAKTRGLYDVGESTPHLRYEDMLQLHYMWCEYMEGIIGPSSSDRTHYPLPGSPRATGGIGVELGSERAFFLAPSATARILQADLHGAILSVHRSRCPSYVGVEGIVIQETQKTFKLLGCDDKLRTILKLHAVFSMRLNGNVIYLHGKFFSKRPEDRSKLKLKPKASLSIV